MRSWLAILLWVSLGWGSIAQAQKPTKISKEREAREHLLDGDYEGAIRLYREIVKDTKLPLEQRIAAQKVIADLSLSFVGSRKDLFTILQNVKKEYQTLLTLDPDDAYAYADYARVLLRMEDIGGAIDALSSSLALGNKKAAGLLGEVYIKNKQLTEAIEVFEIALQESPSDARLWFRLGGLQLSQNDLSAAEVSLGRAYVLRSPNQPLSYDLARSYCLVLSKLGKNKEAIEIAEKISTLAMDKGLAIDAYGFIAQIYAQAEQPEMAVYYLNRAKAAAEQINQPITVILNNQAWYICITKQKSFQTQERLEDAYDMAKQAVKLSERKKKEYLDTQAEAAYLLGRYQEAIDLETEALAMDPTHPFYLGQLQKYKNALEDPAPRGEPISD